jgi:predicted transglutaminase-like cysteine proteinase
MPERLLARAATATLLCLTTTTVMAQTSATAPGSMNAEQGWSAITHCAQEESERARHTCLDRVLRDAGLLTNEMRARQQRKAFGLEEKAARTPPTPPPAAATSPVAATPPVAAAKPPATTAAPATAPAPATPATPPATAAPPAQPDRLEVELTKVEKAVNGRLLVTTSDGAVWLQAESVDMPQPPVAGDRMTIRKGSLNGYRCSVASTHLTYRCVRSR